MSMILDLTLREVDVASVAAIVGTLLMAAVMVLALTISRVGDVVVVDGKSYVAVDVGTVEWFEFNPDLPVTFNNVVEVEVSK